MFIFKVHAILMLELITLAIGSALLMRAHKEECCRKFFKAVGYFIIVVSFLTMICTVYQGIRLGCEWKHKGPGMMKMHEMMEGMGGMGMMRGMGMHGMEGGMGKHGMGMMGEGDKMDCPMGKDCPMMKKMMEGQKTETAPAPGK